MKFSTAIGRLRTVADDLSSQSEWANARILEAYVYGELLDAPPDIDWISLAFVVDLPPQEVTWLANPAVAQAAATTLRFDKYPIEWRWRPPAWPVWNHEIVGPVQFWSIEAGADEATLESLAERHFDQLERLSPPDTETFIRQLQVERDAARAHLESVVDAFYDRDWQRDHKGFGVYPQDHLWWATMGFLELDDAVDRI